MIEFALSLASMPSILVTAFLLVLLFFGRDKSSETVGFELCFGRSEPATCLQPGKTLTLEPGVQVAWSGGIIARTWAGIRRLFLGIVRGVLITVVALLAAIGLHILVGIASALLAIPGAVGTPKPVERSASWHVPAAVDGEALLRSQIVLLRSLSPTKGPAGTCAPFDIGTAIAEAMRRAAATR